MLVFLAAAVASLALVPAAQATGYGHGHGHGGKYGATTLALDADAAAALESLGVSVAPVGPAKVTDKGIAFPITNSIRKALRTGQIKHSGGLELSAEGVAPVQLTDFWIDPIKRELTALVGGARVPILDLSFDRARISLRWGKLRVGPVEARLTDVAAGALNTAFGTDALAGGLLLGEATVRYRLR